MSSNMRLKASPKMRPIPLNMAKPAVTELNELYPWLVSKSAKRAATTHDPKKAADSAAMKLRCKESTSSQIAKAIEAIEAPMKMEAARIPDANKHWLAGAVAIWKKEFRGDPFAIQHAMHRNWRENRGEAQLFVQSSKKYRRWLVNEVGKDFGGEWAAAGLEDENAKPIVLC